MAGQQPTQGTHQAAQDTTGQVPVVHEVPDSLIFGFIVVLIILVAVWGFWPRKWLPAPEQRQKASEKPQEHWLLYNRAVPRIILGLLVVVLALQLSFPVDLPELLAFIAIIFALVSLVDIRKVAFAAEQTLAEQEKLMTQVVGRLGADYVQEAVELYGQAEGRIISVTRGWGFGLSQELQNGIEEGLRKALCKTPEMKVVFSGPIDRGRDFPKVMWRWRLLKQLRAEYGKASLLLYHHPALDVVFTVVDTQMLVGWNFGDQLFGQRISHVSTAALFGAISERMLQIHCPVRCLVPAQPPQETCLPLTVQDGETVIRSLITSFQERPITLPSLLDHLTHRERDLLGETRLAFEANVKAFLAEEMQATFDGQNITLQNPLG